MTGLGRAALSTLTCLVLVSCGATRRDAQTSAVRIGRADVQAVLDAQTAAWNRGDLEQFVATYWNDPDLTFVGSSGLRRGYADLLAGYQRSYPDADARGTLRFELVEVRALGVTGSHALVIGEFVLERPAVGDAQGMFTLVVERRPEGLRIVHDHSSATG